MRARALNSKSAGAKNTVTNVRVVDQYAGTDGARVDRILASLQNSHSQIRVLCSSQFPQNLAANPYAVIFSGTNVRATDDFISFAAQFETFRIAAIRFDVYDINTNTACINGFSTFHDVTTTAYANQDLTQIIDAPDSQVIASGLGKASFTWAAHGTEENEFQSTTNSGIADFGGLRAYIGTGTQGVTKFQVVMKAIVDFRGRI